MSSILPFFAVYSSITVTGQTYLEKVVFMRSEKRSKDAERANRRMEAPLSEKERISTTFSKRRTNSLHTL